MVMRAYVPTTIKIEFSTPRGFHWFNCNLFKDEFNDTAP